jgi:hypothetical protein
MFMQLHRNYQEIGMYFRNCLIAGGSAALFLVSGAAVAATGSTGTASFDLAALTNRLISDTSNFSGWTYLSQASAQAGGAGQTLSNNGPDLTAAASAAAKGYTQAGLIGAEAYNGVVSSAFQQVTTTFELAPGQHFVYSVPYTLSITQQSAAQRIDLGVAFRFETLDTDGSLAQTYSTSSWMNPSHNGTLSSVLDIDVTNNRATPLTVTFNGFLRAENYAAAVPEPASYTLMLLGMASLALVRRRSRPR